MKHAISEKPIGEADGGNRNEERKLSKRRKWLKAMASVMKANSAKWRRQLAKIESVAAKMA